MTNAVLMTSAAADRFMWKSPSLLLASSFFLERVAPMHFSVLPSSLLLCKKYFTVFCLSEQKDSKFSQQQQKIHYPFFSTAGSVFCYFPDIWYCKLHKQGAWEINKFLDLPAWRKGLQFSICVSLSNSFTFSSHALLFLQFAIFRDTRLENYATR